MKVGINGTGIAGPALAYWLRRFGHDPVLFEQASTLRTGGYVVDFWGLGYELAERMGILPRLIERGYAMRAMRMVDAQGRPVASMDVEPFRVSTGGRFISVARSDISSALLDACAGVPVHFGTSVADWEQDDEGITALLSNGQRERFDLVVGADGLHSKVRAVAFGAEPSHEYSLDCHVAAFRLQGYPNRDELTYVSHTEPQRQVARMALRDDATLVLFICRSELVDPKTASRDVKEALWRAFGNMGWETGQILARMEAVDEIYFDHVSQIRLDTWTKDRVALVGDAGACVSFLAGEGTGLAIVEAYVLAGELHRAGKDWRRGLEQYQARLGAFVRAKPRSALGLRSFFTPETSLGIKFRDLLVNTFSRPFVAKHVMNRWLRDDLKLPVYEGT
jgi:2-polyprenyl-6-methoxyphenol hydroxylase-like FAD-dependent oxidoreductase